MARHVDNKTLIYLKLSRETIYNIDTWCFVFDLDEWLAGWMVIHEYLISLSRRRRKNAIVNFNPMDDKFVEDIPVKIYPKFEF